MNFIAGFALGVTVGYYNKVGGAKMAKGIISELEGNKLSNGHVISVYDVASLHHCIDRPTGKINCMSRYLEKLNRDSSGW